ncbi:SpaA isopeptide-forming pilin-related protein [Enterococcus nangangensis]
MKPITKKKGWSLLLVLGILMPYLTGILPYIEVNAEPSTVKVTETILDTSDAKVDVTYEVAEKEITWQVDYTKHATPENVQRQLKLRIDDAASGLGTVRNLNRDAADSEGWYVLHDTYSSKEEKGSLTFKTDIQDFVEGTHYLKFTVQLDEKVSEEIQVEAVTELQMIDEEEVEVEITPATTEEKETVNSTILNDQDAGPHKVTVEPNLIAEVAPQEEAEEEATEESSAEEIVEETEVEGEVEVETGDVETEVEAGDVELEEEELPADEVTGEVIERTFSVGPQLRAAEEIKINTLEKNAQVNNWQNRIYDITLDVEIENLSQASGANVILVMDVSGSMAWAPDKDSAPPAGDPTRLSILKNTANFFIDELLTKSPTSEVSLVTYAGEGNEILKQDFTSVQTGAGSLKTVINGLTAGGATRSDLGMKLAYQQALKKKDDTKPLYVIFLSDGVPTTDNTFHPGVASGAQSWSSMIKGNGYERNEWVLSSIQRRTRNFFGWDSWKPVSVDSLSNDVKNALTPNSSPPIGTSENMTTETGSGLSRVQYQATATYVLQKYGDWDRTSYPYSSSNVQYYAEVNDSQPLLNVDERIYAIQQSSSYPDGVQTFMNNLASDASHSLRASDEESLKNIFQEIAASIEEASIQDTIDSRFELTEESRTALGLKDVTIRPNMDGSTTLIWPNQEVDAVTSWQETFQVQAKENFFGGNAVPTNDPVYSGLVIDGAIAEANQFPQPYVNVRPFDFAADTAESIFWGEAAQSQGIIQTNWATLAQSNRYETFTMQGSWLGDTYEAYPEFGKNYSALYRGTVPTITNDSKAIEYANTIGLGTDPNSKTDVNNYVESTLTHVVHVQKASAELSKLLDDGALPDNFNPTFDLAYTAGNATFLDRTDLTLNANDKLVMNGLALGTYEITENLLATAPIIAPSPLVLTIVKDTNNPNGYRVQLNGSDTLEILNETKEINLEVVKEDAATGEKLDGVTFELSSAGQLPQSVTTAGGGIASFGALEIGRTYQLKETATLNNYIIDPTVYEFKVDYDGTIVWTNNEDNLTTSSTDNTVELSFVVKNKAKTPLPSTGGMGTPIFFILGGVLMLVVGLAVFQVKRNEKGAF